ncbi:helix-turn-helix domain-containing protein [Microlunatus soli]|uniref:Transcriptional regulator, contains XRE-family HTH domain n=1 Tax=Microlunatus soli TaxID=630515 RepID=A0A1H1Y1C2_9ACTN|nr:helix-turn-helix transcriptional regulator [Microlunatus soli]SDT15241.1 Transcriptional regulator, contains XRE-family HTH domain [Microlunatus soli]
MSAPTSAAPTVPASSVIGDLLRDWRIRRRRSQLDVAIAAEVSTRHLSFVETGRSRPSPMMIERLCDELDVPLRERNALHLAAGLAPPHRESGLQDLGSARSAIDAVLTGHLPSPAAAVDVHWDLVAANPMMQYFLADLPERLREPVNMLRSTLHPDGLLPRLANPRQWRRHALNRVRRQFDRTGDPGLSELYAELSAYPEPEPGPGEHGSPDDDLVVGLRMLTDNGELAFLYTVTVFGAPRDVTLDELAIETFFPADDATREQLAMLATRIATDH